MYVLTVVLLLLVLPAASVAADALYFHSAFSLLLIGKWLTFWAVGVRLFIAGVRQVVQPEFTAKEIFRSSDPGSFAIVREVGFGNLSMGLLGICSLVHPGWLVPAAIVGGLYYGFAGAGHIAGKGKNSKEMTALVSDFFVFVVLLIFVTHNLR